MSVEDDQTKWRTVFCKDPTFMNVTTFPETDEPHTVVQSDATKLKATVTPDGVTAQEVTQTDAANFKCTTTPDEVNPQEVVQKAGVRGIWPTTNAVRVNASGIQTGVGITNIYTVPANKILYIFSAQAAVRETADADSYGWIAIRNAVDVLQFYLLVVFINVKGFIALPQTYSPAIELAAGWDVYVQAGHADVGIRGQINGWLEDV